MTTKVAGLLARSDHGPRAFWLHDKDGMHLREVPAGTDPDVFRQAMAEHLVDGHEHRLPRLRSSSTEPAVPVAVWALTRFEVMVEVVDGPSGETVEVLTREPDTSWSRMGRYPDAESAAEALADEFRHRFDRAVDDRVVEGCLAGSHPRFSTFAWSAL